MPTEIAFGIAAWSAWTGGRETAGDWQARAGASAATRDGILPTAGIEAAPNVRRRLGPVGRAALGALLALPNVETARYVLSTRHGEFSRTLSILDALRSGDSVSPTDFSMSVHHSLIGVASIATGNRHGHSAISAGPESFCYGLLEAAVCLTESPDEPVILLHFDELPGGGFDDVIEETDRGEPAVAAIELVAAGADACPTVLMERGADGECRADGSAALAFLRFLLSGASTTRFPGDGAVWTWRRG